MTQELEEKEPSYVSGIIETLSRACANAGIEKVDDCQVLMFKRGEEKNESFYCGGAIFQHVAGVRLPCPLCEARLGKIVDQYAGHYIYESWNDFVSMEEKNLVKDEIKNLAWLAGFTWDQVTKLTHELYSHRRHQVQGVNQKRIDEAQSKADKQAFYKNKNA